MTGRKHSLTITRDGFKEVHNEVTLTRDRFAGYLVGVKFYPGDALKKRFTLSFIDEHNLYTLTIWHESAAAGQLYGWIKSADLNKPIGLVMTNRNGYNTIVGFQSGKELPYFYQGANKNLLPLNHNERSEFLWLSVTEQLRHDLVKIKNPYPSHPHFTVVKHEGLQGGYFDGQDYSKIKVVGPMSREERKNNGHDV